MSRLIQGYMHSDFFYSVHSIALWNPSPTQSHDRPDLRRRNIQVGDVGYFNKDGGFDILFNVFLTEQQNIDCEFDPPPGFVQFDPPRNVSMTASENIEEDAYRRSWGGFVHDQRSKGFVQPLIICTQPCTKSRPNSDHIFHARLSPKKGPVQASLLVSPNGISKTTMPIGRLGLLKPYVNAHAEGWCKYYTSHSAGRMIPKGSLKMVTTSYNSKVWALASYFQKEDKGKSTEIYAKLHRVKPDTDVYRWERSSDPHFAAKTGPSLVDMKDERAVYENQCVALEVHSIQINKGVRAVDTMFRSFRQSMSSLF